MKKAKNFEECMSRTDEIIALLNSEDTGLSDSIKLYAEAAELLRQGQELLDNAKNEISNITVLGQSDRL